MTSTTQIYLNNRHRGEKFTFDDDLSGVSVDRQYDRLGTGHKHDVIDNALKPETQVKHSSQPRDVSFETETAWRQNQPPVLLPVVK